MDRVTEPIIDGEDAFQPSLGLESPMCRDLRSKKYFTLKSVPMTPQDILDPSNHCWCRRTMQVVGPDGGLVRPERCGSKRGCYKSQFS